MLVTQESLRLSQQSITLRKCMHEVQFTTEAGDFALPAGTYIATLLSVTNVDEKYIPSNPPLHTFDPLRYEVCRPILLGITACSSSFEFGCQSAVGSTLSTGDIKYLTSTFGHGFHACPGFSAFYLFYWVAFGLICNVLLCILFSFVCKTILKEICHSYRSGCCYSGQRFALYVTKICLYQHLLRLKLSPLFASAEVSTVQLIDLGSLSRIHTLKCMWMYPHGSLYRQAYMWYQIFFLY